jgi:hypothetical protein
VTASPDTLAGMLNRMFRDFFGGKGLALASKKHRKTTVKTFRVWHPNAFKIKPIMERRL